ncbi:MULTISPECIES: hypothetical protein [unclassified Streptomyces]|uniref:hypothetical protein n=1 Tax=unclassified Streptomyces TaxID=2593676 RepID=UPI002887C642|nr:hypothetical protein [Streptomyces sp. DSM 41633]
MRDYQWAQIREQQAAAAQARAEAAVAQPDFDDPAALVAPVVMPAPRPATATRAPVPDRSGVEEDQELVLEDLTREQVLARRDRAAVYHQVVLDHIVRYGETSAQRLFTQAFVATVQRLSGLGHLELGYTPWGQA